jgi:hypothetical protein
VKKGGSEGVHSIECSTDSAGQHFFGWPGLTPLS